MTKFQKQMLTIAAAGALTAVTALPAMALENEFHGLYNFNAIFSNYDATGASTAGGAATSLRAKTNAATDNVLEQRVRLQYIAKASDDLKLVTHFEINNRFGAKDKSVGVGQDFLGSDLDTDGVNLMTKNAYLDFNIVKGLNAKVGLQGYKDTIGGIFIDADVPAAVVTSKIGAATTVVGFARYNDVATTVSTAANPVTLNGTLGDSTTDLAFIDYGYAVNKDTTVGLSYYYLNDGAGTAASTTKVHTIAANAATTVSGVKLSGFLAIQDGETDNSVTKTDISGGWAGNVQASTGLMGGTAQAGFLYVSGDNKTETTKTSAWQNTGVSTFNQAGMMIMVRNNVHASTSSAYWMKGGSVSNVQLAYLGYNKMITDKLGVIANVGFGWDASEAARGFKNGDYIGTEVNGEVNYKLYPNLTLVGQAGYVALGDQYGTYSDPYTVRLGARFTF